MITRKPHFLSTLVRLGTALALGLGLMTLTVLLLTSTGQAATNSVVNTADAGLTETLLLAPAQQSIHPPRNAVTATLATTVSITYDEAISATTVTSQTFAVHGMQSGLVTETHGVINGNTIIVTPANEFFPGELVYAIATTQTTNLGGTHPITPTVWQFNAAAEVGPGTFPGGNTFGPSSDGTYSVALGDVDGDGDLDAVVGNNNGQNVVYLNNGDGAFPISNTIGTGSDDTRNRLCLIA